MRWDEYNDELSLSHAISDPVETHIDGFPAPLFNAIGCNLSCGNVVTHYNGGVLRIAELSEVTLRVALSILLRLR